MKTKKIKDIIDHHINNAYSDYLKYDQNQLNTNLLQKYYNYKEIIDTNGSEETNTNNQIIKNIFKDLEKEFQNVNNIKEEVDYLLRDNNTKNGIDSWATDNTNVRITLTVLNTIKTICEKKIQNDLASSNPDVKIFSVRDTKQKKDNTDNTKSTKKKQSSTHDNKDYSQIIKGIRKVINNLVSKFGKLKRLISNGKDEKKFVMEKQSCLSKKRNNKTKSK